MSTWRGGLGRAAFWPGCLLIWGCGSTNLTPVGAPQRPRAETCDFQIFTTAPAEGYIEVATVDVQFGAYASNTFTDLTSFKSKIRPYVCRGGGDAAIAVANGYGMYIKATVLKAVASPATATGATARAAATVAPAPAAPSTAPAPAPAEAGCRYDTQCKGNRICVKGDCVDAPVTGPAAESTTPAAPATR
jgi:hypothetical protein